jgi:hypothetical protein
MNWKIIIVSICSVYTVAFGQIFQKDTSDLTFTGTRINPYEQAFDSTGKVTLSGYIDTYGAYYSDTVGSTGYAKFPTAAPTNKQFGLNMIQVSAKYQSQQMRGVATLFYGDIPSCAWSSHLNLIQEANIGFRVYKKWWVDAGYFRTHIGLESIQPRENITTSFATTTYFEPYFLSGAKLTLEQSEKWTFQAAVFNGFNSFVETNHSKVFGLSAAYSNGKNWTHTWSSVVCDETPANNPIKHWRHYTNYIAVYKTKRVNLGIEANFGYQQHSQLADSSKTAFLFSAIAAFKYRLTPNWAMYGRGELFSDPNEILTGPVQNAHHTLVGLDILGATTGIEYKPIPNAFLRIESRVLRTKSWEQVFYTNNQPTNVRLEVIVSLGLWF